MGTIVLRSTRTAADVDGYVIHAMATDVYNAAKRGGFMEPLIVNGNTEGPNVRAYRMAQEWLKADSERTRRG